MDQLACNYNAEATIDNGNCIYGVENVFLNGIIDEYGLTSNVLFTYEWISWIVTSMKGLSYIIPFFAYQLIYESSPFATFSRKLLFNVFVNLN